MNNHFKQLNSKRIQNEEPCLVCKELLDNLHHFFDMLQVAYHKPENDWLAVDDIAKELKISKSVVYRLIRSGELEAINIVENNGKLSQRGHYRINRTCLEKYLNNKKVKPLPDFPKNNSQSKHYPTVKNHLGL